MVIFAVCKISIWLGCCIKNGLEEAKTGGVKIN